MSKAVRLGPLFDLALEVADLGKGRKGRGLSPDEVNAAIGQALAHLERDEANDILTRAAKLVRKQFEKRRPVFMEQQITKGRCRQVRTPATFRKHGDVLVRTMRLAMMGKR
jgi:hypothetical protein